MKLYGITILAKMFTSWLKLGTGKDDFLRGRVVTKFSINKKRMNLI